MGKAKASITITLLLITSALLIVSLIDIEKDNSELSNMTKISGAELSANERQPKSAENHIAELKKDSVEMRVNNIEEESVTEHYTKSSSSGLDIMTDQKQLAEQFNNEEQDYHWSGYWESELQTIVLFVGAKAFVKDSEVECRSSTCEVTVNLSVIGPENTIEAVGALSEEFAQRELKFVPDSIDPANGKIVFYTQPGDIPE